MLSSCEQAVSRRSLSLNAEQGSESSGRGHCVRVCLPIVFDLTLRQLFDFQKQAIAVLIEWTFENRLKPVIDNFDHCETST